MNLVEMFCIVENSEDGVLLEYAILRANHFTMML